MKVSVDSDNEIINRIKKGDESALEFLYKKNYRMMLNLVLKNNGSEDEAKDVFQDGLIVFWQKALKPDFILTSKISTFLYSICQNIWRKELERKLKHTNEEVEAVEKTNYEENERAKLIADCVNSLGDTCKKVLMYYYYDDMSMAEIAEKMGFANSDTAKTKKYKCKQELDKLVKSRFTINDFLD